MPGLVQSMMGGWASRRYRKEAEKHLAHLRNLDNDSMGLVLAIATHQRNALVNEGTEMRDLTALVRAQPMYQHDVAKAVNALIKAKRPHDALGMQVWMHSLRAIADPNLMPIAAAIWRELARGKRHVAKARALVKSETGFELDINMAQEIPPEFADD